MIPTVLLFNVDADKGRRIKALCLSLKLRARSVPVEDFPQSLDALLGLARAEQGVDSPGRAGREGRERAAAALAARLGCAVLLTGEADAAAAPDGRTERIEGGSRLTPLVTGSGCMLSALCGAFAAVTDDMFAAAVAAARFWKRCSARAEALCGRRGSGSFRAALMDAACELSGLSEGRPAN